MVIPLASPIMLRTPFPPATRRAGVNRARCCVAAPCEVRTSPRRRALHRIPICLLRHCRMIENGPWALSGAAPLAPDPLSKLQSW